ncbi:ABC transporter substrate binding protein, partial [Streptococcus anginosus]
AKEHAKELGLNVVEKTITSTNDLAQVAEQLAQEVEAIWVPNDNSIASSMNTLISVTDHYRIPVFPVVDTMVVDGGMATVG